MDTFKIIVIIFLIILTYQIYQLNCTVYKDNFEGFEGTSQSVGGVDDTNAINTLAQIAKNLMAGGVTVPGNMTVQNNINVNNDIHTGGAVTTIGPDKKNKVCLHTPADGRRALYIAPQKLDGSDWEWGNGLHMEFHNKSINTTSNNLTAPVINLGGKFRLSGVGDSHANDDWLRLLGVDNKNYYGGLAAGKLFTADGTINGRNIFAEIDDLKNNVVRKDQRFLINVDTRRNGDRCCYVGQNLIVHGDGKVASWHEPTQQTIFRFLQV